VISNSPTPSGFREMSPESHVFAPGKVSVDLPGLCRHHIIN